MKRQLLTNPTFDSYDRPPASTHTAREALRVALHALEGMPDGAVVPEPHLTALVAAYNVMADVNRALPRVECWCVVKHYASHDRDPNDVWKPAVWLGCTTKEQAEAFAPAIEAHYVRKYGPAERDRFVAERAPCYIRQVINPELTPEEYVEGLS